MNAGSIPGCRASEVGVVRQVVDQLADHETVVELGRHGDVTSAAVACRPGPVAEAYVGAPFTVNRRYGRPAATGVLAAFWPPNSAQRRHLSRNAEQHRTSSTHVWAGSGGACISLWISRSCPIRSAIAGTGAVVRTFRARLTPRHPFARISRSTVQRAGLMPCRRRCSHIFRLPTATPAGAGRAHRACRSPPGSPSAPHQTRRLDGGRFLRAQ